jgi:hypothetical protein
LTQTAAIYADLDALVSCRDCGAADPPGTLRSVRLRSCFCGCTAIEVDPAPVPLREGEQLTLDVERRAA